MTASGTGHPSGRRPPRPLLVGNDFPPDVGGIQRYVESLAARLPDVAVVAGTHPRAHDAALPYPVRRGQRQFLWPTPSTRRLVADAVSEHDAGVVVVTAPFPLVPVARGHGVPVAVVCHGAELIWPAAVPGVAGAYRRWLRAADALFTVSGYTAAHVRRLVGPDGPPIRLARPGVDVEAYRPLDDAAGEAARDRHGLPGGSLVVSLGRLVPRKGTDVLLRALPRIRAAVPDAHLVVVGDGRSRQRLERLAATVNGGTAITFTGRVPDADLPSLVAAADVAAMPVRRRWGGLEQEGFGIVFLEAQACGVPVVVGRSGGAPETVVDGVTGVVVDGDDVREVADAVIGVLRDPRARGEMARAARQRAEHFDWRETAARFHQDLAALAAGRALAPEA